MTTSIRERVRRAEPLERSGRRLPPTATEPGSHPESGFALVATMVLLVLLSVLGVAALNTATDQRMAGRAVRESAKTFYAAEAGLNAVISGWPAARYDTMMPVPGDSLVVGPVAIENGCSYVATLQRVDGGTGVALYTVRVVGRGRGGIFSQNRLSTIVSALNTPAPGLSFGGDALLSGNPVLTGCTGIHANGNVDVTGTLTAGGTVSAGGTVNVSGNVIDEQGNPVTPTDGAPAVAIPDLDPMDYCGDADYHLRNGWVVPAASPGDSADAESQRVLGWEYNSGNNLYELKEASEAVPGTVCAEGSVKFGANIGSPGSPLAMTILATGWVEITSNSYLTHSHPAGYQVIASGDIKISGNHFSTLMYAGSQCDISGSANFNGGLQCRDDPDPAGVESIVSENKVNGNMTFNAPCSGGGLNVSRLTGRSWTQS